MSTQWREPHLSARQSWCVRRSQRVGHRRNRRPNRIQVAGDLVWEGATFNRRKDSTGVSQDVSVGGEVLAMDGALSPFFAERLRDCFRTDPAIAVPLRAAIPQPDTMHHAGAEEPMVFVIVDAAHEVRTVAQIAAIQLSWYVSGDR